MTEYPSIDEVLAVHDDQIERYGGTKGIRDEGLLEAAVMRPQTGYYDDIIAEAAALWESLAGNHPFIDGNKRTSCAVVEAFLETNGIDVKANNDEMMDFLVYCYYGGGAPTRENLEAWLRDNTTGN